MWWQTATPALFFFAKANHTHRCKRKSVPHSYILRKYDSLTRSLTLHITYSPLPFQFKPQTHLLHMTLVPIISVNPLEHQRVIWSSLRLFSSSLQSISQVPISTAGATWELSRRIRTTDLRKRETRELTTFAIQETSSLIQYTKISSARFAFIPLLQEQVHEHTLTCS